MKFSTAGPEDSSGTKGLVLHENDPLSILGTPYGPPEPLGMIVEYRTRNMRCLKKVLPKSHFARAGGRKHRGQKAQLSPALVLGKRGLPSIA